MSENEIMFRHAARAYAERNNSSDFAFYSKVNGSGLKEVVAKVPLREEWTKLFFFDGIDTVSIKNRLSEKYTDKITVEAFCLAYGG